MMWSLFIVAGAMWLMIYLVGTLSDSVGNDELLAANTDTFDAIVELTEKKVTRYLGQWEFSEPKIPGHFHHIGRWYSTDKWNFCIDCHGPTPHSRTPKERAFLNMHSLFVSCNTCHVREQMDRPPSRFGWLSLDNGQLCPNPEMAEGVWGEYGAKIVPLRADDPSRPLMLQEARAFSEKFHENMDELSDRQKVIANKFVHKNCLESPITCTDCHKSEKAFIDFTALGYSQERAAFLMSTEVVDLASHYETFYIPSLLNTEDRKIIKTGDEAQ
jgi:hypothetical protein